MIGYIDSQFVEEVNLPEVKIVSGIDVDYQNLALHPTFFMKPIFSPST
jgi:hypothetical protein